MKNVGSRFTALVFMLILCAVIGVYRLGWFDVTFISRPYTPPVTESDTVPETDSDNETETDTPSDETSDETSGDTSDTSTADTTAPVDGEDGPDEVKFIPYSEARKEGYVLSYADWVTGKNWTLAVADVTVPSYFSSRNHTVYDISYVVPNNGRQVNVVYNEREEKKPALELYMGYILIETKNKNRTNIYNSEGERIGSYDPREVAPAYCRDTEGRPLFTYKGGYYYLNERREKFIESDYDPDRDLRGACFDYTPDYGVINGNRTFNSIKKLIYKYEIVKDKFDEKGYPLAYKIPMDVYKFSLADSGGSSITEYRFFGKYAFSEARAAVVDEEGRLFYINESGKTVIKPSTSRYDREIGRTVYDYLMEPVTNGPESIGFYFFEHGLCRARIMSIYSYYLDHEDRIFISGNTDVLMYRDGTRFPTPVGYDIISYSDGMILLEKDGKYGYMSYTGEWIVDPSLTYAEPFYEGLAVIGKYGERALIDTDGDFVIPYETYDYISHASSGLISVYGEDGWQVLYKCEK